MAEGLKSNSSISAGRHMKLARFFLFSVGVALVPILFRCMPSPTGQPSPTLADAVAHGELLLVGVGAAATALGEMLGTGKPHDLRHLVAGGMCNLTVIAASLYFAGIPTAGPIDPGSVLDVSGTLFTFSMLASTYTITLSEVAE
ncbi:MAG TPA: hypothetical protein VEY93_11305 [Longimicrobium sp.]|nr:hypothetical protein [Longimicrobium sp.]